MIKRHARFILPMTLGLVAIFSSEIALCSVESSLTAIQTKLINTILPLVAILGLVAAAFSFVAGHQNARSHLMLAILGAAVGFGAPAIMEFIRGLVH